MAKNTIRQLQIKAQEEGNASQSIQDTYAAELKAGAAPTPEEEAAAKKAEKDRKDQIAKDAHDSMSAAELQNLAERKRLVEKSEKARPKNIADSALAILKLVKGK
jgi:hypothetical protein